MIYSAMMISPAVISATVMEIPTHCRYWSTAPCSPVGAGFLELLSQLKASASVYSFVSVEAVREAKGPSNEERLDARFVDPRGVGLLSADESSEPVRGPKGRASKNGDHSVLLSELVEKNLLRIL